MGRIVSGERYNDEEFLYNFHVDLSHFTSLLDLVKDHPAICRRPFGHSYRSNFSPELHLLVTLKYLGMEGNGAWVIKVKEGLGISKGSVMMYIDQTVDALLSQNTVLARSV